MSHKWDMIPRFIQNARDYVRNLEEFSFNLPYELKNSSSKWTDNDHFRRLQII
jgi:hypothetical protein